MTTTSAFRLIPLTEIHESPHNPRQHFDGPALAELTDSIRKVGVLTPAIVRPHATGFELAAGHRRFRASQAAGLEALPCLVREMDDQAFMEVLTIENLQREDVHPLDEAAGYEALMAAPYTMPVESIAARVGKSVKYVYDRVKLLALCPDGRELFWAGLITAGHAILLARLSEADQQRCIDRGLLTGEGGLYDERAPRYGKWDGYKAVSVRELQGWIDTYVRFDAEKAEPILFPETVHTVAAAIEQEDAIVSITREHFVRPEAKIEGMRTYGPTTWKRADGQEKSKPCDHAVTGVVVVGVGRGEAFKVCVQKKKCLVHWKDEVKAAEAREKGDKASPAAKKAADRIRQQEAKRQAEEAARKAREERWEKALPGLLKALAEVVRKSPATATGCLADRIVEGVRPWRLKDADVALVPRGKTAEDLVRHAAWLTLLDVIGYEPNGVEALKAFKLDPVALLNRLAPEEKPAPASAAKTKADRPAGKGAKAAKKRKAA